MSIYTQIKSFLFILLICWSIFIVSYFYYTNLALLYLYIKLVKIIISGDYYINFNNIYWKEIWLAIIGILFYTFPLTIIFKEKKKKISPRAITISFIIGLGTISVILELLGIFHFLHRKIIILVYLVLILLFLLTAKKRKTTIYFSQLTEQLVTHKIFYSCCLILIILITSFTFYHALFYPETYWDSLIYYLHYGKMIFEQNGFPTRVCAQVGLGLGANYPHLFPLIGGTLSILFGGYSDIFGQFIAPFAGLLATILLYFIARELFQSKLVAITTALLFRSVPFGIAYFTYATDYALVMLFTAGFLYTSLQYLHTRKQTWLWITGFIAAIQTHINYLGWIFFPVFVLLLFLSKENIKTVCLVLLFSILIAIPWYLRNWLVTGNPVYAFFPEIFGGKYINREVLASCYHEWRANGIGVPGETVFNRILYTPQFFFSDWRFAPVLFGFAIPGIILGLIHNRNRTGTTASRDNHFIYIIVTVLVLGLVYHIIISPFYLYQIVFIIPAIALLSGYFVREISEEPKAYPQLILVRKISKKIGFILVILVGLVPGLAMSIMGHKYANPNLIAFQHPGINHLQFMELVYGDAVPLWQYINKNLKNTKLLTHDNRYHMYDDSITIVHLDDWDIQHLYTVSNIEDKLDKLQQLGIQYYLFIPNERNHPIVSRLNLQELIDHNYLIEIYRSGEHILYQFNYALLGKNKKL
ncbi:MAG: glycosyltransferase family 39 protein [bacterium]|nr:glycosyltransferase family 39 protein [bacterium]